MKVNIVNRATAKTAAKGLTCMKCRKPIEAGQPYKWAKGRYSHKRVACGSCSFSRADLTDSKMGQVYEAIDGIDITDLGDMESVKDDIASVLREVAEEYRSVADEYFSGGGPNAETADEVEGYADEVESIDTDFFTEDDNDSWKEEYDTYEEYVEERLSQFRDEIGGVC